MTIPEFIEQTDFDKRFYTWNPKEGSPLTESLVINTYDEALSVVKNNVLMNFMDASKSLKIFLRKEINGISIGTLLSSDVKMFDELCISWIFPSDLMVYATEKQHESCARHMVDEAYACISYDGTEGKTPMEYCIKMIQRYKYNKEVSLTIALHCRSVIVKDANDEFLKFMS